MNHRTVNVAQICLICFAINNRNIKIVSQRFFFSILQLEFEEFQFEKAVGFLPDSSFLFRFSQYVYKEMGT